jgi:hypothetical protein
MLPAGVVVGTPLFALHNTVHNWREPLAFLPERWLDVPVEAYVYDGRGDLAQGEPPLPGVGGMVLMLRWYTTYTTRYHTCACLYAAGRDPGQLRVAPATLPYSSPPRFRSSRR